MTKDQVQALAKYLTGPDVALSSVALGMPEGMPLQLQERANRFFSLREAFGVSGWATQAAAEKAITKSLTLAGEGQP